MSRVQLALRVSDLEGSIAFYRSLFGVEPAKLRPGYANFAIVEPPLKLVLIEGEPEQAAPAQAEGGSGAGGGSRRGGACGGAAVRGIRLVRHHSRMVDVSWESGSASALMRSVNWRLSASVSSP